MNHWYANPLVIVGVLGRIIGYSVGITHERYSQDQKKAAQFINLMEKSFKGFLKK